MEKYLPQDKRYIKMRISRALPGLPRYIKEVWASKLAREAWRNGRQGDLNELNRLADGYIEWVKG